MASDLVLEKPKKGQANSMIPVSYEALYQNPEPFTVMHTSKTKMTGQNKTAPQQPTRQLLILLALFVLVASNAFASLIAHEPYNYALGAAPSFSSGTPTQTSGGGFSSGYNGGGLTTVAGLTYPGLGTSFNALKQTAAYSGENLSSPPTSGTIYVSYLFNMSGNRVATKSAWN